MRVPRLVVLAAMLIVRPVGAAEPSPSPRARTSTLGWARLPGAESCVDGRDLARGVERRLGRPVFVPPSSAELGIEGHVAVAPPPAAYRAVLHLRDEAGALLGTRELEGNDPGCGDLASSVELAVALMVDPDAAASWVAPAPPPAIAAPIAAPGPAPVDAPGEDAPAAPGPARPPWTFLVAAGPTVAAGVVPGVAPGAHLRARLDPEGFPAVGLSTVIIPPSETHDVRFLAGFGGVAVCPWTGEVAVVHLAPCLGFAAGALDMAATTVGMAQPFVEVSVSRRLAGRVVLSVTPSVATPLLRPTLTHGSVVFEVPPVAGHLDLGIGVEVP